MQRYQQSEHWLRPSSPPSYKTQFDLHLFDNDELPTSELRPHFTPLSEALLIKVQHRWLGAQLSTVDQIVQTTKHDHDSQERKHLKTRATTYSNQPKNIPLLTSSSPRKKRWGKKRRRWEIKWIFAQLRKISLWSRLKWVLRHLSLALSLFLLIYGGIEMISQRLCYPKKLEG